MHDCIKLLIYDHQLLTRCHRNETKVSGMVSITLKNSTTATGYFFATNVVQMTSAFAYIISPKTDLEPAKAVPIFYAYNATSAWNSATGSIKFVFSFDPSSFLAQFLDEKVFFGALTKENPNWQVPELFGKLKQV